MPALKFDGTNDRVRWNSLKSALATIPTGAETKAFLGKRGAANLSENYDAIAYLLSGATGGNGTVQSGVSFKGAAAEAERDLLLWDVAGQSKGATRFTNTTEPFLIVIKRAAGTVKPRAGWKIGKAGSWTFADLSATIANALEATMLEIGAWQNGDFYNGHMGAVGIWSGAMSDANVEALDDKWATSDWWNSAHGKPVFLCEMNVAVGSLVDLAGNASSIQAQASSNYPTLDAAETLGGWSFDGKGATRVTLGVAIEADSAQAVSKSKAKALTAGAEADSARALLGAKLATLKQGAESDSSRPLDLAKRITLTRPAEADVAVGLQVPLRVTLSPASESNAGIGVAAGKRAFLSTAAETPSVQSLRVEKRPSVALAVEAGSVLSVSPVHRVTLGAAAVLDLPQSLSIVRRISPTPAEEADLARPIGYFQPGDPIAFAPAEEFDQPQGIRPVRRVALTPALQTCDSLPLSIVRRTAIEPAEETNTAQRPLQVLKRLALGQAGEASKAEALRALKLFVVSPATEADDAIGRVVGEESTAASLLIAHRPEVQLDLQVRTAVELTIAQRPALTLTLEDRA